MSAHTLLCMRDYLQICPCAGIFASRVSSTEAVCTHACASAHSPRCACRYVCVRGHVAHCHPMQTYMCSRYGFARAYRHLGMQCAEKHTARPNETCVHLRSYGCTNTSRMCLLRERRSTCVCGRCASVCRRFRISMNFPSCPQTSRTCTCI